MPSRGGKSWLTAKVPDGVKGVGPLVE